MSWGKLVLKIGLVGLALFAYQNCAPSKQNLAASTHRDTQSPANGKVAPLSCRIDQIHCDQLIFAPGLRPEDQTAEVCSASGSPCVQVRTVTYDTSNAMAKCQNCTDRDSEPGGQYNYTESYCTLPGEGGEPFFAQGYGDVESTIETLLEACERARSTPHGP